MNFENMYKLLSLYLIYEIQADNYFLNMDEMEFFHIFYSKFPHLFIMSLHLCIHLSFRSLKYIQELQNTCLDKLRQMGQKYVICHYINIRQVFEHCIFYVNKKFYCKWIGRYNMVWPWRWYVFRASNRYG